LSQVPSDAVDTYFRSIRWCQIAHQQR